MNDKSAAAESTRARVLAGLTARNRSETRFKLYGIFAVTVGIVFLGFFFASIVSNGYTAFSQSIVQLDVYFDPAIIDPAESRDPDVIGRANFGKIVKNALYEKFPDVQDRRSKRLLTSLVSSGAAFQLRDIVLVNTSLIGQRQSIWVLADDEVDMYAKGRVDTSLPEGSRRIKDNQLSWLRQLEAENKLDKRFNWTFFSAGDSREPELAGIWGAVKGSFFMLLVTIVLAFPLGVAAAIYLEEFAPKNKFIDLIEVNINNLAAVPSIVFGLLGLSVFINFLGMPRSAPLVGGLVLTLMTIPVVIIAARSAIKSVPPSIRDAALGLGASPVQAVAHHILPLALPGMLTGAILGMARALGESAPLLMIGMIAFIVEAPQTPLDPSTALPVQVYLWADSPERAFVERTSAAILVLLAFLLVMNATAVWMRSKFEKRW